MPLIAKAAVRWQDVLGTTPETRWGVDPAKLAGVTPDMARLVRRTAQLPPHDVMLAIEIYVEDGRPDLADMFLGLIEQDITRLKLDNEVRLRRRRAGQ